MLPLFCRLQLQYIFVVFKHGPEMSRGISIELLEWIQMCEGLWLVALLDEAIHRRFHRWYLVPYHIP